MKRILLPPELDVKVFPSEIDPCCAPTLIINGEHIEIKSNILDGIRYHHVSDKHIIKIDNEIEDCGKQAYHEVRVLRRIDPEDRIYFPKLIGYNIDNEPNFIITEKINFLDLNKEQKEDYICRYIPLIKYLSCKYKLEDVFVEMDNWAINRDTEKPVIYDLGI